MISRPGLSRLRAWLCTPPLAGDDRLWRNFELEGGSGAIPNVRE